MKLDRDKYIESRCLRPRTLLIVIVSVNVLLGLVVALFPKEGIPLGDDQKLKFVSFEELSGKGDTLIEINIDEVLAGVSPTEEDSSSSENVEVKSSSEQSVAIKDTTIKPKKKNVISRSIK